MLKHFYIFILLLTLKGFSFKNVNNAAGLQTTAERSFELIKCLGAGDCINTGDGCRITYWEPYCDDDNIHPFSLIYFSNYSKLSMIEELNETEEIPLIAPAIVLKYCDDKDFNNVTVKRLSAALDVVTIVSGVGSIKLALNTHKYARALYEIAQVLSASGNIAVTVTNDPDIALLKQDYDNIMLVWDMANIVSGSGKIMTKAYNSLKNGTAHKLSKTVAQNFITRFEQLKLAGKQLPDNFKKLYVYLKSKIGGVVNTAGKYTNISEFWAKITGNVDEVKDAFTTSTLKYAQEDMYVFRHCNNGAPQLSNWYTDEILTATQARIKLALPNSNTAQRVVKVKISKGTAYVEGGVTSQVNNSSGLFGNYATGGGKQFYVLDEDKVLFQVIEDIPNPKGN